MKYSIAIAGAAGQGIDTVADFLAAILKESGLHVFVWREFMSRIRGGINSVQLRVTDERTGAYTFRTSIAVVLDSGASEHLNRHSRISDDTVIVGEQKNIETIDHDPRYVVAAPFSEIAKEVGGAIYLNSIAAGVVAAYFNVKESIVQAYLSERFSSKGEEIVKKNTDAYTRGFQIGQRISDILGPMRIRSDSGVRSQLLLSGSEAIALGALAGGCNFISSYPMSPSTGVLTFLAQHARYFGVLVDQAEDEIAAMNKGLGAWYAGGRAIVTTSGGGFALMTEGLSLAGMLESPMVIHLAQRPGPATGLPTRTGQEDLKHALGASHGEFPRVIYTPGTYEDAFFLTQRAFNTADQYQVPVFVLTDQFLLDSLGTLPMLKLTDTKREQHVVKTRSNYRRYLLTETGISPRGIPSYGEGLVVVDSDEHDESGHITEDLHLRTKMVDKRLRKKTILLRENTIPPTLVGAKEPNILVIAWGSNYHVVKEAISELGQDSIAMLHFSQVYPLHETSLAYLRSAKRVAIVENNASAQFAGLIQRETGFAIASDSMLLKYNGLPFAVEEVVDFLRGIAKQEMIMN